MHIDTLTTESDWQTLAGDWERMVERCGGSVFLTMEWLVPWWRHLRRAGDRLAILVAREGDDVVGLAPLYRRRTSAYGLGFVAHGSLQAGRREGFLFQAPRGQSRTRAHLHVVRGY